MGPSMSEPVEKIIGELQKFSNSGYRERMESFGIAPGKAIGVPVPDIRRLAKVIAKSAETARELWASGIHEAMILSTMIFPPEHLTQDEAEKMVRNIGSWDICDHFAGNLVARANPELILKVIDEWAHGEPEFVRRAAFSLIASLDQSVWYLESNVIHFLGLIIFVSGDDRNFVKKGINWALREIGKSSPGNRALALKAAEEIIETGTRSGRWIGKNAKAELNSFRVKEKLSTRN